MSSGLQPEWRMEQVIASYDVDPHQRVRLPALCRFMQEAAYHHAEHLGLGHAHLSAKGMAWVLARQRIVVDHLPMWGDTIHIRTWPSGRDRLFFYRDFKIVDGAGKRVLVASNAWSLIDIDQRKRVSPEIYLSAELPQGEPVFETRLSRLKGNALSGGETVTVTYGDLDLNGHVNNVRYIEWALDRLPLGFLEMHSVKEMEINYLAEAVYGQTVRICSEEQSPLRYVHAITAGEIELFRATMVWEE